MTMTTCHAFHTVNSTNRVSAQQVRAKGQFVAAKEAAIAGVGAAGRTWTVQVHVDAVEIAIGVRQSRVWRICVVISLFGWI